MARPILIIEDDPDIAEVLRYGLEARQFETRVALTGKEGLSASLDKDRPPLLILLDLLLPEMNGLEICRRVRSPLVLLVASIRTATYFRTLRMRDSLTWTQLPR